MYAPKEPIERRSRALTDGEEEVLRNVWLSTADRMKLFNRQDLVKAVHNFVSYLPFARKNQLLFHDLTPGQAYIKGFAE